jgi:hypothetical protein
VATDDHQRHNALAFVETGAARLLEQRHSRPELLLQTIMAIVDNRAVREQMQEALSLWQKPNAAGEIAESILNDIGANIRPIASPLPNTRAPGRIISIPPAPIPAPAASAVIASTVAEEVAI